MSDIAFSVIVNNNGIDDIVFKTIMLKGDKGNSVDHIEKTSTSGLVDTYTIYLTDGTTGGTFTVTNGAPVNIDDTVTAIDKTWSSSKLSGMIKSIDDNVVDADKLWSSQKINSMLVKTGTIEDVAIASFSDGADDVPVSELVVDIDAWQEASGEIHGWDECNIIKSNINIWDEEWELGTISTATGENAPSNTQIRSKNYISVIPSTSYYNNGYPITVYQYDANKNFIGYSTIQVGVFTTGANTHFIRFWRTSTTYNNDISINYPATDTSYHAHDGGVDTIDLTETIYGGVINVSKGLLDVTFNNVDLGSLTWNRSTSYAHPFFYASLPNAKPNGESLISNGFEKTTGNASTFGNNAIDQSYAIGQSTQQIFIRDDSYTDKDSFTTAMNGIILAYENAIQTSIQITPTNIKTLLGENRIFADTGNVEKIVYFKTGSEPVARMIEAYMRAQPEE